MNPYRFRGRIVGTERDGVDGPDVPEAGPLIMTVSGP